jgi:nucleotide-binding universal stress UspA family protein
MMRLKNILVPVDFSKESELAVEWAVKLAREENDATLYLLHTFPPVVVGPDLMYNAEMVDLQRKQLKEHLESWRRKVPPPLSSVTLYTEGDLVTDICAVCNNENIDLVVMTTHGRRGLSRVAHPNATEKVVRLAPCPVLALHLSSKMQETAKTTA